MIFYAHYITVQGMMQHWQSSPHQHGNLIGDLVAGPLTIEDEDETDEVTGVVEEGIARAGETCCAVLGR